MIDCRPEKRQAQMAGTWTIKKLPHGTMRWRIKDPKKGQLEFLRDDAITDAEFEAYAREVSEALAKAILK